MDKVAFSLSLSLSLTHTHTHTHQFSLQHLLFLSFKYDFKLSMFIFIASKRLSDLIRRPYDLYRAGVFDEYLMGLMNQVAQAMDDSITQEVK